MIFVPSLHVSLPCFILLVLAHLYRHSTNCSTAGYRAIFSGSHLLNHNSYTSIHPINFLIVSTIPLVEATKISDIITRPTRFIYCPPTFSTTPVHTRQPDLTIYFAYKTRPHPKVSHQKDYSDFFHQKYVSNLAHPFSTKPWRRRHSRSCNRRHGSRDPPHRLPRPSRDVVSPFSSYYIRSRHKQSGERCTAMPLMQTSAKSQDAQGATGSSSERWQPGCATLGGGDGPATRPQTVVA